MLIKGTLQLLLIVRFECKNECFIIENWILFMMFGYKRKENLKILKTVSERVQYKGVQIWDINKLKWEYSA